MRTNGLANGGHAARLTDPVSRVIAATVIAATVIAATVIAATARDFPAVSVARLHSA